MARPREFDHDTVLDALRDVFWELGYDGASYADIMAATGLKKGSLYSVFGDKRALYQEALARYDQEQVSPGVIMLRDKALTPDARIGALFDALVEAAETRHGRWGCLLCNAAIDQAPFDKDTEDSVSKSMTRMKTAIRACIKGTSAEDKTEILFASYFGGRVLIKSGAKKSVLRTLKKQALSLFD